MDRRLAALFVVVLLAANGCSGAAADVAVAAVPRASADPAAATDASTAVDAFGFDLYHRLAADRGNLVFSPASIALALAMARAGARGETAAEMDRVLRAAGADAQGAGLNALEAALTSRSGTFRDTMGKPVDVALRIANAPFAQRGERWETAFLEALASRYGASLRLVDYKADPEVARETINAWVADRTEQRILHLLGEGSLTKDSRLTLVNAVYLKAAWATPFHADMTTPAPFTRLDGSSLDVPTMHGGGQLRYTAGTGWQAVELPYVGDSLALTMVVPDDLATFERGLDGASFAALAAALQPREVDLSLPKFGTETTADLADALAAMGMAIAFDPARADFSGMTTDEALSIARVVHQADIDVDEKGTEAAAATAVAIAASAAPADLIRLRVDRPFLFALRDIPTGAILFLGRIVDPSVR